MVAPNPGLSWEAAAQSATAAVRSICLQHVTRPSLCCVAEKRGEARKGGLGRCDGSGGATARGRGLRNGAAAWTARECAFPAGGTGRGAPGCRVPCTGPRELGDTGARRAVGGRGSRALRVFEGLQLHCDDGVQQD